MVFLRRAAQSVSIGESGEATDSYTSGSSNWGGEATDSYTSGSSNWGETVSGSDTFATSAYQSAGCFDIKLFGDKPQQPLSSGDETDDDYGSTENGIASAGSNPHATTSAHQGATNWFEIKLFGEKPFQHPTSEDETDDHGSTEKAGYLGIASVGSDTNMSVAHQRASCFEMRIFDENRQQPPSSSEDENDHGSTENAGYLGIASVGSDTFETSAHQRASGFQTKMFDEKQQQQPLASVDETDYGSTKKAGCMGLVWASSSDEEVSLDVGTVLDKIHDRNKAQRSRSLSDETTRGELYNNWVSTQPLGMAALDGRDEANEMPRHSDKIILKRVSTKKQARQTRQEEHDDSPRRKFFRTPWKKNGLTEPVSDPRGVKAFDAFASSKSALLLEKTQERSDAKKSAIGRFGCADSFRKSATAAAPAPASYPSRPVTQSRAAKLKAPKKKRINDAITVFDAASPQSSKELPIAPLTGRYIPSVALQRQMEKEDEFQDYSTLSTKPSFFAQIASISVKPPKPDFIRSNDFRQASLAPKPRPYTFTRAAHPGWSAPQISRRPPSMSEKSLAVSTKSRKIPYSTKSTSPKSRKSNASAAHAQLEETYSDEAYEMPGCFDLASLDG